MEFDCLMEFKEKAVNLLMNKNFDLRIFSLCQANEVENERHVMFSCTLYDHRFATNFLMKSLPNI